MKEGENIEFKSVLTKDTAKTVVAFSNCNGGTIFIGVDDNGKVIGLTNPDQTAIQASQLIRDTIRPDVTGIVHISDDESNGKDLIRIDVSEGSKKPYYLREKGPRPEGVYIRSGPVSVNATNDMIRKMFREETPFETMVSKEQDLTFVATKRILEEYKIPFDEPHMKTMGFYSGDLFTNLAYILSDQCTQGIKIAVYHDDKLSEFIDSCEIDGSVLEQMEKTFEFIDRHNPHSSIIKGMRRKDFRPFPEPAIREAVINAVAHREYAINGPILISMFNDRMVINSLGGLNPDIGLEDIMMGVSSLRNPKLSAIFHRMRLVESFGTGIQKIMMEYDENVTVPKIKTTTNVFSMTLPSLNERIDISSEGKTIVKMMSDEKEITRNDVEKKLNVSKSKATNILGELVECGVVDIEGTGKSTRYVLSKR